MLVANGLPLYVTGDFPDDDSLLDEGINPSGPIAAEMRRQREEFLADQRPEEGAE